MPTPEKKREEINVRENPISFQTVTRYKKTRDEAAWVALLLQALHFRHFFDGGILPRRDAETFASADASIFGTTAAKVKRLFFHGLRVKIVKLAAFRHLNGAQKRMRQFFDADPEDTVRRTCHALPQARPLC